jgi:nicotinate phosphoribosyltransferase
MANAMAPSLVLALSGEAEAFRAFAQHHPDAPIIVDTYDTMRGVRKAISLARDLRDPMKIAAIRIDSGDLLEFSRRARNLLNGATLDDIKIMGSGGLNEHDIEALIAQGAPIDAFAVDGDLLVSADAPALELAYQLTEFAGEGRVRLSAGKRTLPGRKQVFRTVAGDEAYEDVIGRFDEALPGRPLLTEVMRGGRRVGEREPLTAIRDRCKSELGGLPVELRALAPAERAYPVEVSAALRQLEHEIREKHVHSVA